jgi:tellurium resistance protein TerZ
MLGLAWDVTNGVDIDLDASAVCLDRDLRMIDLVYFKQLRSSDGSIHHSGDEREGDSLGDDEKIIIALNSVNPEVEHIVFVINTYSGQELDDIAMASCHLFDPQSRKDLATYTMTNNSSLDKHTALLLADLYRDGITRDWMMRIISQPTNGKTARQCVGTIGNYLRSIPTAVAAIPPNHSVITNEMPVAGESDLELLTNHV